MYAYVRAHTHLLCTIYRRGPYRNWTDCGPHFRCYEMAALLLVDKVRTYNLEVAFHLFCEKHEEGRCDGSFGLQVNKQTGCGDERKAK